MTPSASLRPKILVVDDHAPNLIAIQAILEPLEYGVVTVSSAELALTVLLQEEFAVILMDVQMPGMDGFEAAEVIKAHPRTRNIPIIFITAINREAAHIFRAYDLGAVDYLLKPFEPELLRAKVAVFVDLYRKEDKIRVQAALLHKHEMRVGILGHDLRNPLGAIALGAAQLHRMISDESQLDVVRRLMWAADRMTRMIEQLLDLTRARLGSGLGPVGSSSLLDVGDVVQRAVDELRGVYPEREVIVERSREGVIAGDGDRLLQLFSNLIGNALRHGAPGSAVSVRIEDSELGVSVRVQNAGVIPAAVLPSIFDPFRMVSSGSGGLGLGLFISREIAIAHGGSIGVESGEPAGTILTIQLPKRPPALEPRRG